MSIANMHSYFRKDMKREQKVSKKLNFFFNVKYLDFLEDAYRI